ncbi:MAG: flavin reductase [Spirochaetaceae bacterium]|jgi:flavin reductase (DIM6/NTAB) family NADH-FMN oxidoreductase RutF|nr:flavin reductase [Spirochaetaceae bacterium]
MKQKDVVSASGGWIKVNIREFEGSPVQRISDDWMLISAGDVSSDKGNWNTMTASWGTLGVLWNSEVIFCFIRPGRHTFGFVNSSPSFSCSFFHEKHHNALEICGSTSGRDTDKAVKAALTPVVFDDGSIGFAEAQAVITCTKLYFHDLDPANFLLAGEIEKNYPQKDYHRMFVGKITAVRLRDWG